MLFASSLVSPRQVKRFLQNINGHHQPKWERSFLTPLMEMCRYGRSRISEFTLLYGLRKCSCMGRERLMDQLTGCSKTGGMRWVKRRRRRSENSQWDSPTDGLIIVESKMLMSSANEGWEAIFTARWARTRLRSTRVQDCSTKTCWYADGWQIEREHKTTKCALQAVGSPTDQPHPCVTPESIQNIWWGKHFLNTNMKSSRHTFFTLPLFPCACVMPAQYGDGKKRRKPNYSSVDLSEVEWEDKDDTVRLLLLFETTDGPSARSLCS